MKLSKDEQRKYREANPDNAGPIYQEEPKWFGSSILPTIIIPQAPFGDPKMDGGERWDLKAKARFNRANWDSLPPCADPFPAFFSPVYG